MSWTDTEIGGKQTYIMAIIVSHPRRTIMSNAIHAATRVVRPMKIVPIMVKERGGLYDISMA